MKRGFTIIELLVASLLLGILVTILTMIFNQSSMAWRIGVNGISDLGNLRYSIGTIREVADNAFVYDNKGYRMIGLWDRTGQLRTRACDAPELTGSDASAIRQATSWFFNRTAATPTSNLRPRDFQPKQVGGGAGGGTSRSLYVNVKSGGPKNDIEHYQAIWSAPDDPNEWN